MNDIKYSVLILTHNRPDAVEACLKSVVEHTPENAEIIVLDNGSDRITLELFGRFVGRIDFFLESRNLGVAAGRQRLVDGSAGETLIFLDSDTVVGPNWLVELVAPLALPEVGICGPAGSFVDWALPGTFMPAPVGLCDVVSGWCMAVKRDVFRAGAIFDTEYGLFYEEDSDLCLRAHDLGWYVFCTGQIGVQHKPGHSGAVYADRQKTMRRFQDKWQGAGLIRGEGGYERLGAAQLDNGKWPLFWRVGTTDQAVLNSVTRDAMAHTVPYHTFHRAVDVGAGIGAFTRWLKAVAPGCVVEAIENAKSEEWLLRMNAFAFADVPVLNARVGYSSGAPDARIPLEYLIPDGKFDLLRIGVEGAEYDILLNASLETLCRFEWIVGKYHEPLAGLFGAEKFGDCIERLRDHFEVVAMEQGKQGTFALRRRKVVEVDRAEH